MDAEAMFALKMFWWLVGSSTVIFWLIMGCCHIAGRRENAKR